MRTTIRMNQAIARRAKQFAARTNRSFTRLIEEAVADFISRPPARNKRIDLPVAGDPKHKVSLADIRKAIDEEDLEYWKKMIGGRPHARS
jgi:hypothetical protein